MLSHRVTTRWGAPRVDMWTGIALPQTGHGREAAKVLSPSNNRNPCRSGDIRARSGVVLRGTAHDAAATISKLEALIGPDDSALNRAYVRDVSALLHLMAGRLLEAVSAAEEGIAATHKPLTRPPRHTFGTRAGSRSS